MDGYAVMGQRELRARVVDELAMSAKIIYGGHEVVPRVVVEVPNERGYVLLVPMPDDLKERMRRMDLIAAFIAWKGASGFVKSSELMEPDAAASVAVDRYGIAAGVCLIERRPLCVGPVQWLAASAVGDEIPALLPPVSSTLSTERDRRAATRVWSVRRV